MYCGLAGSGKPIRFELAVFFIFGTGQDAAKLLAERIYFDNETVLRQMRGEENAPGIGLANLAGRSASTGNRFLHRSHPEMVAREARVDSHAGSGLNAQLMRARLTARG